MNHEVYPRESQVATTDIEPAADDLKAPATLDAAGTLVSGAPDAAAEVFACTICESTEHRASEHANAVARQAAIAADLIARPASLLYDVTEPAGFVEPCSMCE